MKKLEGFQKGVNLGGWLSQGSKEKSHLDTFIVEEDIEKIANMGCDHIRLPIDYENIEDDNGVIKESGYNYIENCIQWCKKYHLNIVLDLHKTMGYIFDDANYSAGFFENKKLQDHFINTWDNLSKRFSKYSNICMFEMLNEVTLFEYSDSWNEIALRCIKTIRKNAPTVKILYGGVGYSAVNAVKLLSKPYDENIVYNIHCYEPLVFTHQGAYWVDKMPLDFRIKYPCDGKEYLEITNIVPAARTGAFKDDVERVVNLMGKDLFRELFKEPVEYAEKMGVPLYCGEYGVIDRADPQSSLNWIRDITDTFREFGIGRAIWSYKKMDFGITDDHYETIYNEIIKLL